jgi:hypothetical protein
LVLLGLQLLSHLLLVAQPSDLREQALVFHLKLSERLVLSSPFFGHFGA